MTQNPVPTAAGTVLAERAGPVLVLTLNRPDRLNAWNNALEDRYFDLLEAAEDDGDVRAIVVTGAGRGFSAGADMEDLQRVGDGEAPRIVARPRPRTFPLTVRKPMIAAGNGAAAGLGLVEALYCDVRFCSPKGMCTTAFARRGLIAEYGIAWLLPRLVGTSNALDLLLSARVVQGEEACAMGLVNRVVEPERLLEEAVAYGADLAEHCSPRSMAAIKRQVQLAHDGTLADAVAVADRVMHESFTWPDAPEGVASYLEQRSPAFPSLAPRS